MADLHRKGMVKDILAKSNVLICDNLDPKPLLGSMLAKGALDFNDVQLIENKVTTSGQAKELISILTTTKEATSYDKFMAALSKERKDIYMVIVPIEIEVGYTRDTGSQTIPLPESQDVSGCVPAEPSPTESDGLGQTITEKDMHDIIKALGPNEIEQLYVELGLEDNEVSWAKGTDGDGFIKAKRVLLCYLQSKGEAATRSTVIEALKSLKFKKSMEKLTQTWTNQ